MGRRWVAEGGSEGRGSRTPVDAEILPGHDGHIHGVFVRTGTNVLPTTFNSLLTSPTVYNATPEVSSLMRKRSPNEVLNWLVVVLAFSVPLYRAWVSLAAYLILILWFFQGGLRERLDHLKKHRLTIAIIVFMALNLLSLIWSEDPAGGFTYWRKYLYLLLVPAIASSLRPVFAGRAFLAFLTGAVCSVLIMPVVILADLHIRHIHPGNPAATMSHLDYSMVLAVAGLLVLVHMAHTTRRGTRLIPWIAVFLVIMGGLVLNIGRSGQFAFAATLVVLIPFVLRRKHWFHRAAVLACAGCVLIAAYAAVPRFQERVDRGVVELHDAVLERRIDTNQGKRIAGALVGLEIIRSSPVLGTGIGGNMLEFRRLLETDFPEYVDEVGWFPHFHNQYLQVTTELGVVGLLSLLAIFAALIAGRYRRPDIQAAALALGCAYLFGFIGDPFLHKQMTLVLFALAAGIISADDEVFAEEESTVDSLITGRGEVTG
jgi:O-antigen ligase